jgi:hypothetical protein
MPRRRRPARMCALAVLAVALPAAACAGGRHEPKPVAALASSPQAAAAFDAIRDAWDDTDEYSPAAIRAMLERFLAQFASDGLVPLARSALALLAMKEGDLATADIQIALTQGQPPGTAQDLRTVARARRLRLGGAPEAALELLRPLLGKGVDPLVRAVFEEELTIAALMTHRDYEAISYMDSWLRATAEDDRPQTLKTVTALVERLPRDALIGALQAMRTQRATFGYGIDIQHILAERLVRLATEAGDVELARLLLDPDAGAIVVTGDAAAAVAELATSRRGLNVVEGRTIGLLVPTDSPGLRDEAADLLRGVMWALGLPRGVRSRSPSPPAGSDAGVSTVVEACAPLEAAPELDEPRSEEGLRLVTRDDAGSTDRTEVSLDELAGEGAAIVVAGLDGQTATRALRWGANHEVPVIALVPPAGDGTVPAGDTSPFGFVLGEPRGNVVGALVRAVPSLASQTVVPVVDASEAPMFPPQGGRFVGLTLTPPVSCDIPSARAGDPRFPIAQWGHDKIHAWLVSGSIGCAADVVAEVSSAHARGVVALTLEATALPAHAPGLHVVSAEAGVLPARASGDPREEELQRFSSTLGHVGWWTALGRDAATLARVAVRQLPGDTVSDAHAVTERRRTARDKLASARARLWTTEAAGWGGDRNMKRALCAVEVK